MASRVFAVDLGAWSVKLAIASPGLRGASLLSVVERPVPPGDEPTEIRARAVLAQLISELRLRDDSGYIGVYGDQVFTQVLEFGFKNLRRTELDKAVGGELESVVPVDLEDMVYAFEPLPQLPATPAIADGPQPGPPEAQRGRVAAPADGMRVLSYAMRRDRAEHLIELGRDCGFEPRGILASGGAAIRLVGYTPSLARARADGAVAVIDIGHERTDVAIVASGKAVFSRSIMRAGKRLTETIMRNWQKTWEEAEVAKHLEGFIASAAEPATSEMWQRIHQVMSSELQPFARDLRQTLAACRARTGFAPVAALLVGGGARLRGMASYLSEQLGIPTWLPTADDVAALAGPRLGSDAASALPIETAAMTIGMAFDAAGGRPMFDLRSGALAVKVDFSFLRAKAVPLGAAALAIAAFAAGSAYADLYRLRRSEAVLHTRLAADSQAVFHEVRSAEAVLAATAPGGGGQASPMPRLTAYDLLLDISSHIPPKDKITLDLDHLTIENGKVDLEGKTKTSEEIDLLITELKKIDCFKNNVTRGATSSVEENKQIRYKFSLTIKASCMGDI